MMRFSGLDKAARRLAACRAGNSLTEFALMLPLLITAGMYGLEMTWMHNASMQVSQVAIAVADNAARMEQSTNTGTAPTVTEADINAVLSGGRIESNGLDIAGRGRIIISSLEINTSGSQYIHWQRCSGGLTNASRYGAQGTVVTSMGSGGTTITAPAGSSVMFAEVYYRYRPLFGTMFVQPMLFHQEAAFLTRDDRNLTAGTSGTGAATC
ncbi:MAG: pilus assembly protein TadE [Sphingomonadales bacterium]|nr:pilus assembly protein TadE [Sphingomonadales bacterium]